MAEINNKVLLDLIAEMEKNATVDAQEAVLNEIVTNAKFLIPAVVTEIPPEEAKNLKNPEHNTRIKFSKVHKSPYWRPDQQGLFTFSSRVKTDLSTQFTNIIVYAKLSVFTLFIPFPFCYFRHV